jgi:NitT/TauT family transport system permease protein
MTETIRLPETLVSLVTFSRRCVPGQGGWRWASCSPSTLGAAIGSVDALGGQRQLSSSSSDRLPAVVLAPLAILLYGQGVRMRVVVVAGQCSGRYWFNTVAGARAADPVTKDTARSFGLGRFAVLRRVVLPAAAPFVGTGVRVAAGIGLIVTVSVELLAGNGSGIGGYLLRTGSGGGR